MLCIYRTTHISSSLSLYLGEINLKKQQRDFLDPESLFRRNQLKEATKRLPWLGEKKTKIPYESVENLSLRCSWRWLTDKIWGWDLFRPSSGLNNRLSLAISWFTAYPKYGSPITSSGSDWPPIKHHDI